MRTVRVQLSDEVAARLDAAARAGGSTTAATAAALLGEALDPAPGGAVNAQPVRGGVFECPDCGSTIDVLAGGTEAPDGVTLASLVLAFHRGDAEGAMALLRDASLPLLLADAVAMINRIGIDSLGADAWDAQLQASLTDAAARRAAEGG